MCSACITRAPSGSKIAVEQSRRSLMLAEWAARTRAAPISSWRLIQRTATVETATLARELGVGELLLKDILDGLGRPGRDPREDAPAPILREDVLSMDDLAVGMVLKGTVRNVVDFGSFIDIGVKQDGLLHRSQVPQGTRLQVGDILDVEILKIEADRGRISLGWAQE